MTDIVIPTPIDALPPAPLPTDTPAEFDGKSFALLGALAPMVAQTNDAVGAAHINATAAQEQAQAAAQERVAAVSETTAIKNAARDYRDAAAASALAALESANFRGGWSALTGPIAMPATVLHSGRLWVLLQPLADVTAAEPGVSAAWASAAGSPEIIAPTNASPTNGAASIQETPTLTGSTYYEMYGAAQTAIQVQIHTSADFSAPAYSSGDQPAGTSFTLPAGVLQTSNTYYWRIRYKSARGVYSDWSAPTSFATAAQFSSYISAPTATPSNFGDALEGGFYAGMIWNELVQSATSTTISTGSKTFTVPSMSGAPIVYAGQQLEVRSRANPANKMVGTVTGAVGTSLTLNITSVGGSGTFADWSIMSRYRVIVAPKASGENAGIALKNANTAFPVACQTLTEGLRATQAMRDADTSTVYPAAHWARELNIGGRTDWYIPARDELELCWRNLKPTADVNHTIADRLTGATPNYANSGSYGDTANTHGLNNNSAPAGAAYTSGAPAQTAASAFRTGGAEAFEYGSGYYWSSSEYDASNAWGQYWHSSVPGYQDYGLKTYAFRVRAVRRSII